MINQLEGLDKNKTMNIKLSNPKIFSLLLMLVFSACSETTQKPRVTGQSETKTSASQITPTPFQGKTAKIRGEYAPVKIAGNLEDSVEQQELPKIWLEFEQENDGTAKVELDGKFNENLQSAGEALFHYQFVIHQSENPDERYDAIYNHTITFVNSGSEMRRLEINSPDGKRKLTEAEINEIFNKQAGLINDRYYELDDYFYPKSSFYKFKKSVNEKFGYSIF